MTRRRLRRTTVVLAGALAMVLVLALPAHATLVRTYEGSDYASLQTSDYTVEGYWVEVCDMEQDGNGVYGLFINPGGWKRVGDGNGSAGGCGNTRVSLNTYRFRVCEDDWGADTCSSTVEFD